MSSAHVAEVRQEVGQLHAAFAVLGVNLRGLPRSRAVSFWRKANRTFLVNDSGSVWPCSSLSFGFWSNRSIWLGAPSR